MKYNLIEHKDSITKQYLDLILDLGLDPTNINLITYLELKLVITQIYPVIPYDNQDPNVANTPEFILDDERKKTIYIARRLHYFYKLLKERTLNV